MKVSLHQFHASTIDWFQKAVSKPSSSRNALARGLCERKQRTCPTDELCLAAARKVLAGRSVAGTPPVIRFGMP